jgi:DNA-binding MarR family transcriptional regulator
MKDYPEIHESLGAHLGYASRAVKNALKKKFTGEGYNFSFEQWHLLMFLWFEDNRTQKELAELCQKDKATMTRLIEGLARRNYLIKSIDPLDHRSRRIKLTEKGREVRHILMPMATEVMNRSRKGLTDKELILLKKLLRRIFENLETISD